MSGTRYVSTISGNGNDIVAVGGRRVDVGLELGEIRDVGKTAFIRSTYAARYNFGVQQYNYYETEDSEKKRSMRGGRFFLYTLIIIVFLIGIIISISKIHQNKLIAIPPIAVSILYLFLTCFNWHIHRTNGSLIHENMIQVNGRGIHLVNKHFVIPIHARIQDREFLAATDGSTTAILARLQQRYHNLTEIRVMLYSPVYKNMYTTFSCETIIHFVTFFVLLFVSIIVLLNQTLQ